MMNERDKSWIKALLWGAGGLLILEIVREAVPDGKLPWLGVFLVYSVCAVLNLKLITVTMITEKIENRRKDMEKWQRIALWTVGVLTYFILIFNINQLSKEVGRIAGHDAYWYGVQETNGVSMLTRVNRNSGNVQIYIPSEKSWQDW